MTLRVGLAGTPAFAVPAFEAVLGAGFEVPLVLTQPDRPGGRGLREQASPVKVFAEARGLPLLQPATLKSGDVLARLSAVDLDVLVVAAYGLILPPAVLAWPRHGCINVHASILPRWRGAAPIHRALLAGDAETGVTIMQMEAGLDTGPMHRIERTPIGPRDTGGTLHDRLAQLGAGALVAVLGQFGRDGRLAGTPQPAEGATYAAKITRADTAIDWRASAAAIDRQVRAFAPAPGAVTQRDGEPVKLWVAEPRAAPARRGEPGEVLAVDGGVLLVACGEGALAIAELQPAGKARMSAAAYVAGRRLAAGARFDVAPAPA